MKAIVRILFLLAAVNGVLLYLHYSQSAGADGNSANPGTYRQEIEVINRADGLYIVHHFYNLPKQRNEIIWPKGSTEHGCPADDSAACSRLNEAGTAFEEGDGDQQSIAYKLPKKEPLTGRKLFKRPFAALQDAKPLTTVFHMTDEQGIGGMWVNGLERIGIADKERITYRLYRGVGTVDELYWQPQEVPLAYSSDRMTIYAEGVGKQQIEQMKGMLEGVGGDHISIILSPRNQTLYAKRFIVDRIENMGQINKQIAKMSVQSRYKTRAGEPSMNSMLASILGNEASGTEAEQAAFRRMKAALSGEQYSEFRKKVRGMTGGEVSASLLDSKLLEVTGFESDFFEQTMREKRMSYPFLQFDPRKVLLDGKIAPGVRAVVQNGKSFYPARELLTRMGYQLTSNNQSIYIQSPKRTYRFSKIEPFYVMNSRRVDYQEKPYTMINKKLYFDEVWLRRIFLVLIEKNDETIDVQQIEQLIKEMEKE